MEVKIGFYALSIVYNLVYQIFYRLSFPCYVVFSQYPWVFIYLLSIWVCAWLGVWEMQSCEEVILRMKIFSLEELQKAIINYLFH